MGLGMGANENRAVAENGNEVLNWEWVGMGIILLDWEQ